MAEAVKVTLTNLIGGGLFVFRFFPKQFDQSDGANWEPQNTLNNVKPLQFANREPSEVSFDELIIDKSDRWQTVTRDIDALRALMTVDRRRGTPPPLLLTVGDFSLRCVMVSLKVSRKLFSTSGAAVRAYINMSLRELQSFETTSVTIVDSDSAPRTYNIGDF